jgi:hypothetical protein
VDRFGVRTCEFFEKCKAGDSNFITMDNLKSILNRSITYACETMGSTGLFQ